MPLKTHLKQSIPFTFVNGFLHLPKSNVPNVTCKFT